MKKSSIKILCNISTQGQFPFYLKELNSDILQKSFKRDIYVIQGRSMNQNFKYVLYALDENGE